MLMRQPIMMHKMQDVSDIVNASDEEAVQMLTEVYNAYSFD